ncbi:endonuclease domain-containing protein [bacterium]|nr:endonuclease domain-containing protein [bacterium]
MFFYNNLKMKQRRRALRKSMTIHERILWSKLKNGQIERLRFFRQYSVGAYVLDFYCPKLRLCVELDGSQHLQEDNIKYDQARTDYLNSRCIRVMRFFNSDVNINLDGILEEIYQMMKSNPLPGEVTHPFPLPPRSGPCGVI